MDNLTNNRALIVLHNKEFRVGNSGLVQGSGDVMISSVFSIFCSIVYSIYAFPPHTCFFMITRWLLSLQVSLSMFHGGRERKGKVLKSFLKRLCLFIM